MEMKTRANQFQLFVLLIFSVWDVEGKCSTKFCSGPFLLKREEKELITVKKVKISGILFYTQKKELEVLAASRKFYVKYCDANLKAGGACETSFKNDPPERGEVKEWIETGMCDSIVDCEKGDSWCWGSDTYRCSNENRWTKVKKRKIKPFTRTQIDWRKDLYSTCLTDWMCAYYQTTVPIVLKEIQGSIKGGTFAENGTWLSQESMLSAGEIINPYTRIYSKGDSLVEVLTKNVEAQCYLRPDEDVTCDVDGFVYLIKNGSEFSDPGSSILKVPGGPFYHVDGNHHPKKSTAMHCIKRFKDIDLSGKSPSMLDLSHVANTLIYLSSESQANSISLSNELREVYNLINLLYLSVGKLDPKLIPTAINQMGTTKWVNDKIFELCKCDEPNDFGHSTCSGKFQYKYGMAMSAGASKDECINITNPQPLNLANFSKMSTISYHFPIFTGASFQWDGYAWVNQLKETMVNYQSDTIYEDTSSFITTVLGHSQLFTFMGVYQFIVSNMGAIALGLSVYTLLKMRATNSRY